MVDEAKDHVMATTATVAATISDLLGHADGNLWTTKNTFTGGVDVSGEDLVVKGGAAYNMLTADDAKAINMTAAAAGNTFNMYSGLAGAEANTVALNSTTSGTSLIMTNGSAKDTGSNILNNRFELTNDDSGSLLKMNAKTGSTVLNTIEIDSQDATRGAFIKVKDTKGKEITQIDNGGIRIFDHQGENRDTLGTGTIFNNELVSIKKATEKVGDVTYEDGEIVLSNHSVDNADNKPMVDLKSERGGGYLYLNNAGGGEGIRLTNKNENNTGESEIAMYSNNQYGNSGNKVIDLVANSGGGSFTMTRLDIQR